MSASYILPPGLPLAGGTMDPGSEILLATGSISSPSIGFTGFPTTGFFYDSVNTGVGLSIGGLQAFQFSLVTTAALIAKSDSTTNNIVWSANATPAVSPTFSLRKSRGTQAVPVLPITGDQIGRISWQPATVITSNVASFTNGLQLRGILSETSTVDATHSGSQYQFWACPIGSATLAEVARMDNASGLSMFGANTVIDANRVFRRRVFTVGTLPTGVIGMSSFVSDALGPTFGAAVVGGGTVQIPVYYDGAWKVG